MEIKTAMECIWVLLLEIGGFYFTIKNYGFLALTSLLMAFASGLIFWGY